MGGDAGAIQALWREHRRWIAAVLLAYKPRHADLEDLLQEVAMTLVTKISTIRDETNVRAWLRTVAVNAARAEARSGKARPRTMRSEAEQQSPETPPTDALVSSNEHVQRVLAEVQALPEAYREPLMLRAVRGLRSRQIAQMLDIPEATVDTRVARARRMLRQRLGNETPPNTGLRPGGVRTPAVLRRAP